MFRIIGDDDSEFKQCIDTLKILGIPHIIEWHAEKKDWQRAISLAGYNITALACTIVQVGSEELLFSNGQVEWDENEKGYGPSGLFMLSRNRRTKTIKNRIFFELSKNSR